MRVFLVGAMLLLGLAAGCLQPAIDAETGLPMAVLRGEQAPEWELGQWWTFDTNVWGEITIVVFDDHDTHWHVATSDPALAWYDVMDPISFLGMVNKSDLAGSQEGEVRYFDFPLTQGKNWTTFWTGFDVLVEVHSVDESNIHLHAYHPDGWHRISYDYDPRTGWFTRIVVYDEQREPEYEIDLVDHGTGFEGRVAAWKHERLGEVRSSINVDSILLGIPVPEGTTDLLVDYAWECEDQEVGRFEFTLHPPMSPVTGESVEGDCTHVEGTIVVNDPEQGEWSLRGAYVSAPGPSSFTATALSRVLHWQDLPSGEGDEGGEEGL